MQRERERERERIRRKKGNVLTTHSTHFISPYCGRVIDRQRETKYMLTSTSNKEEKKENEKKYISNGRE